MMWYRYFTAVAAIVCAISLLYHLFRLIRLGRSPEYSRPAGSIRSGIVYSFTGAMNPSRKESAYLHLPTYIAGLLYHLGTFLAIVLAFVFFFNIFPGGLLRWLLLALMTVSCLCGCGIFIKRVCVKNLRFLSVPDDYISNLLVTLFQFLTLSMVASIPVIPVYFVFTGILFLYIPVGKLKHALYFFAVRYRLGLLFGWRGVWPEVKGEK